MGMTLMQWRIIKNFTQAEVGKAIGVHGNVYGRWEKHPEKISLEYADKIAKLFGEERETIFPQGGIEGGSGNGHLRVVRKPVREAIKPTPPKKRGRPLSSNKKEPPKASK